MGNPTRPAADHIQDPKEKVHPIVAAAGYPTVLAVDHIGSAAYRIDSEVSTADPSEEVAPREIDTGSVGDQEVEGVNQQDGSSLARAVGYLCLRRTWKYRDQNLI